MHDLNLPIKFIEFLKKKNWKLFEYQTNLLESLNNSLISRFLISSDTGTGKTISLFLPIFIDNLKNQTKRIIYISPLKSILSDLYDNLNILISELGLKIGIDKRTGDESSLKKKKQLENPKEIILTTPESLALMITKKEADKIFKNTDYIAVDELNEIINNKRGDQLALTISRILEFNKNIKILSSSTNISNYQYLSNWISFKKQTKIIKNEFCKNFNLEINLLDKIPDSGHSAYFALDEIYNIIKDKRAIIFVNTRAQSEILYKDLFIKYPDLKIGIYHSSLSKKIRQETEFKIKNNEIKSIISTSSLEMGIDWKNIQLVVNIGTPKSVNKLIQRTGRSNHDYNSISQSVIIPTNKFEYFESIALKNLIEKKSYDLILEKDGSKDVLCQHLLLISCHSSFSPNNSFNSIKKSYPYKDLTIQEFNSILSFIYDGGYVLKQYKKWTKLKKLNNGKYEIKDEITKRDVMMNVGTIIDSVTFKVITTNGKLLGTVEESFFNSIKLKGTFIFAGLTLVCKKINNNEIIVETRNKKSFKVPIFWSGSIPVKSNLSDEILSILENYQKKSFPDQIKNFLDNQKKFSKIPTKEKILIENFPYMGGQYIFFHTFLGRETNQTISNLLINFLNKNKIYSLSYILNDYSFGIFLEKDIKFKEEHLNNFFLLSFEELNSLDTGIAKRIFKEIAMISGLLKKNDIYINKRRSNFINSDIIFDTLRKYEPEHIILKITKEEINNHLIQSSQIKRLKTIKFEFVKLNFCSEFSKSLIMEKEKIKINELI